MCIRDRALLGQDLAPSGLTCRCKRSTGERAGEACGTELFLSETKYNSGCGWPAFFKSIDGTVEETPDTSLGMVRIEITCKKCKIQYLGQSKRSAQKRMVDHLNTVRNNNSTNAPVGVHFRSEQHSHADMTMTLCERIFSTNPHVRLAREREGINNFGLIEHGLTIKQEPVMHACCDGLGHCTLPLSFIVVHKMLLLCILGFFKEQCHLQLF